MNKAEIRKMMKEKLELVPNELYDSWSREIAANLFNSNAWKEAGMIGITISRGKEVHTRGILEKGWQDGKRMVVPKCDPVSRKMTFRILTSFDQLESIYYGLQEPIETATDAVLANDIDLLIVPGLAYSKEGYRIGFGGGYYDRFLCTYKGKTASLAFEVQLVDQLPIETHDIPVNMIITNKQVVLCS